MKVLGAPADVRDGVLIDLRDHRPDRAVLDLRGTDAPPVVEVESRPDPNRVAVVGSRWVLLLSLALLNVLDLLTTRAVLAAGGAEANPLMSSVINSAWGPVIIKSAGVALVVVVVNACPPDSKVVNRALALTVLTYAAIVSWNMINLLKI